MVWVSVQNFSFQYLRKNYHKANCHHICLLHMHAHVYQYISLPRFWYKINISICHVSGIKSMSICHASDTGQNYFSKKCFLQSWNGLLLLWHFPLLSDIFKRGFCALESYCIQRKENDNIIDLFPCFLRKKLFFFSVWILHIQKETTPVTHQSVLWQNLLWCINATQLNYIQILKFGNCYHALNRISCAVVKPLKVLR